MEIKILVKKYVKIWRERVINMKIQVEDGEIEIEF